MGAELEYDAESDATYLRFVPSRPGIVHHSVECEVREDAPPLVIDVSADGHIVGIEIVSASRLLGPRGTVGQRVDIATA